MRKYDLKINDKPFSVHILELSAEEAELEVNGKRYRVSIDSITETLAAENDVPPLRSVSSSIPVSVPTHGARSDTGSVSAPIPGSIMAVFVKVGDKVQADQPLFKMEAMKMENEINAHLDGTVSGINVSAGDTVSQGQELMTIAPDEILKNRRKTDA
jgi:glutaconyl-CoA/methylmalonyl-CoA decarboxylase subunit gamma